jgi:hypothetical protein
MNDSRDDMVLVLCTARALRKELLARGLTHVNVRWVGKRQAYRVSLRRKRGRTFTAEHPDMLQALYVASIRAAADVPCITPKV